MKRIIIILIVAALSALFFLLVRGIIYKTSESGDIAGRIKVLPSFSLPTLEGGVFNSDNISEGPLLIVYFHPECEHCQYEISSLLESDILSKGVRVLLVSHASQENIKMFIQQFRIENETLQILSDSSFTFGEMFGINVIPSNLIYDRELRLVKFLKGEIRTEVILNYLEGGN